MEDVRQRVKRTLVETLALDLLPDELGDDDDLQDIAKLRMDSVDTVEILAALEEEFGIEIEDVNITSEFHGTVQDLTDLVIRCQAAGKARPE